MNAKRFRVALSFPGEKRDFICQVADILSEFLGKDLVLYDEYLTAELARPDLDVYLGNLYHEESELIVPFFCADYERKQWCGIEWRQMRDILKRKEGDRIMPFRFDDTPITGFLSIDGYVDIGNRTSKEVAELILQRINLSSSLSPKNQHQIKSPKPHPLNLKAMPLLLRVVLAVFIIFVFCIVIYFFPRTSNTIRPQETTAASSSNSTEYPDALPSEGTIRTKVYAKDPNWLLSEGIVRKGQIVRVSVDRTNHWATAEPDSPEGYSGAQGYDKPAGSNFELPGAPEGCLLMKLGDGSVEYWTNNNETKIVNIPGKISFMANDQTNHPPNESSAYEDNRGFIVVRMTFSNIPSRY